MPEVDVSELLRSVAEQADVPDLLNRVERGVHRRRQRRALTAVAAVVLVGAGTVAGVVGVEHSGGTTATTAVGNSTIQLAAHTPSGQRASTQELNTTASILMRRMMPFKIPATLRVTTDGLRVTVPTADVPEVEALIPVGSIRFRQVLELGTYEPAGTTGGSTADAVSQAPTLTPSLMTSFDKWNCSRNPNPTNGNDNPGDYVIACDTSSVQSAKYLLGPASVNGAEISTASAGLDQTAVNWVVNVTFNRTGATKWLALTKKTYETDSGQPSTVGSCSPPTGCNAIGITIDGQVESAPYIETDGIPGGRSQISGTFTQRQAAQLASVIKYGALPVKLAVSSVLGN